jgi:molecular chaperone DnaJ
MAKDYYKTLGIEKNASKDEIKKAFRKLAHEHHPDKATGNEAKFKEINEAYGVLSDDSKRAQYDQFGSDAFNGGAGGHGGAGFGGFDFSGFQGGFGDGVEFDLGDIFGGMFGGGGGRRQKQNRGSDISVDVEISFKESIFGTDKEFSLHRTASCDHCKGSRGEPGTSFDTCKSCDGKGQVIEIKRSVFGAFQSARQCDTCMGTGKIPKEKCKECKGKGVLNKKDTITIIIPAGIDSGETLRVSGRGEAIAGGASGDLYVRVHVLYDSTSRSMNLRKNGVNLSCDLNVKLSTALLGGDVTFETLEGPLTIEIPQGITHGEILRVRNKGVPISSAKRGDLMVHIHIIIPKKISKEGRKHVEELMKEGI